VIEADADLLSLRGDGDQKRLAQPWNVLIHRSAWKVNSPKLARKAI